MRISFSSLLVLFLFYILMPSPTVYDGLGNGGGGGEGEACLRKNGKRNNKKAALRLKVIAMVSISATSLIGVCLPLFSTSVPVLGPDRDLFIIAKVLGLLHHPRHWFHACVAGLVRCAKVAVPAEDAVAQVPLLRLRGHGVDDSDARGGLHCYQSLQQTRGDAGGRP